MRALRFQQRPRRPERRRPPPRPRANLTRIRILDGPPGSLGALVLLPADKAYDRGRNDQSILVSRDLDQAAVVHLLGGGLCTCGRSDGTVACGCATLDQHLAHTRRWIKEHDEDEFDDPGYFQS